MDEPAPLRFMPLAGQNPKGRTKNLDTSARKKQEGYTKREKRGRGSRFQPAIRNSRVGRGGIKSDKRREQEGKQNYSGAVAFFAIRGKFRPGERGPRISTFGIPLNPHSFPRYYGVAELSFSLPLRPLRSSFASPRCPAALYREFRRSNVSENSAPRPTSLRAIALINLCTCNSFIHARLYPPGTFNVSKNAAFQKLDTV